MSMADFICEGCKGSYGAETGLQPHRPEAASQSRTAVRLIRRKDSEPRKNVGITQRDAGIYRPGQIYFARLDRVDAGISVWVSDHSVRCHRGQAISRVGPPQDV